ncbi:penicillin-binding transpeptidase domain-containing protein [Solwaraspora sp. WMMD1047]|uniref:penicillin-binding transpeptidase domain-containing protein n=1 Tax=Solwaraspora sp. WMMD1047 TaxID=3016102 RepID=UPI002417157F|nr:penicillin-binding transpeptidase domain-containing protein [Solwaraspora sp. WMMD1047]MDG4828864.1 penicillin-binding transpeptidase domain-containing protein [Solwaraspora sp. WMMD1047]
MRLLPPYPKVSARRRTAAALACLTLAAAGLTGCSDEDGPEQTVDAFLAGWRDGGGLDAIGFLNASGQRTPAAEVTEELKQLSGELAATPPALRRQGEVTETAESATATVQVDWTLPGGTHWSYPTEVRLQRGPDDEWQVVWEPTIVQEKLTPGDQLAIRRVPAARGAVLDAAGQPIVTPRPVVQVGVQPSAVTDPAALVRDLDAAFRAIRPALNPPVDLTDLPDRLKAAKPDAFVDVVLLRREAYLQIKPRIHGLDGTRFVEDQRDLAPTREFARALLGSVDPVQKADLEAEPGVYAVGDLVGHGGLQGGYEQRLRGTAGTSVIVTRTNPAGVVEPTGTELFRQEPRAGAPIRTTLDVRVQTAADAALAGEPKRSALVAVRVSDGALLAVANGPGGGAENLALTAQVPPGSTFKMVSTLGLLDLGAVGPDTPVDCPKTFTVDGRSFKNSDDFALGRVPFHTDFARSCNTAFAALAPKLGPDGLAEAGRSVGLEAPWELGVEAFSGKVSTGGSAAERAAAAFGQGTTLVSPVAMAGATAAVARGQWQQPKLLLDPAPANPAPAGPQLKPGSVEPLRTMMREVVTAGTATALKGVPGSPVHGKTGTAEFDDNPANTHAWFVGWQGDVAIAVFVEKGGASGASAVPIAANFLRAVNG